jgi:polygalacturonase
MNTVAINVAIDRLSDAGGGTLSFPPGRYLTGTIYLKSGVTLHLENGAVIVGSTNIADYPKNQPPFPSKTLEFGRYSLIYAGGQHDIAITGGGKIYVRTLFRWLPARAGAQRHLAGHRLLDGGLSGLRRCGGGRRDRGQPQG